MNISRKEIVLYYCNKIDGLNLSGVAYMRKYDLAKFRKSLQKVLDGELIVSPETIDSMIVEANVQINNLRKKGRRID